jgi:hypothetical protein
MEIDKKIIQKLLFIHNCLNEGWTVKKISNNYIFSKNHECKRKFFKKTYLREFVNKNLEVKNEQNN